MQPRFQMLGLRRTASRIDRKSCNDKRCEIVCLVDYAFPVFGQPWLLTAGSLIGVSVVFAKVA